MWYQDGAALDVAGRILMAGFFIVVGASNMTKARIKDHIDRLTLFKAPFPTLTFWIGIALQFVSSILVLSGWNARYGAMGLILFTVLATLLLLRFWEVEDPMRRNIMRNALLSNTAILGGLMLLLQNIQTGQ